MEVDKRKSKDLPYPLPRWLPLPKPGPTGWEEPIALECMMAPGPLADGGWCIELPGGTTDAGLIADIQMRTLYCLKRSVTNSLKLT